MMRTIIGYLGTLIFNEASFFSWVGTDQERGLLYVIRFPQNKGKSYEWQEFPKQCQPAKESRTCPPEAVKICGHVAALVGSSN